MDILFELLSNYTYARHAIVAAFFSSIACGLVGTLVISNRLTFLAGGASHAAYGGIGSALYFGLPLLPCTLIFSAGASMIMALVTLRQEKQGGASEPDASIGVLWAAGMAFGIILMQLTPGYNNELMGFLFGSILVVPLSGLYAMGIFDCTLIIVIVLFRQGLWAISLDRDFAASRGLAVNGMYLLLVALTAVTVVMLIHIVGLILVLALLTIPPYVASRFCQGLFSNMVVAACFALLFCLGGLAISLQTDITPGPCIVAVATVIYAASLLPLNKIPSLFSYKKI